MIQRIFSFFLIVVFVLAIPALIFLNRNSQKSTPNEAAVERPKPDNVQTVLGIDLNLPEDYSISIFAEGLGNPRVLTRDPAGNLIVSSTAQGKVYAVSKGGTTTVAENLDRPHGLAFYCHNRCQLYIAENGSVSLFDYDQENLKATNKTKVLDLPGGGGHFTRTLLIRDDKLYVAVGSSCNVCKEEDGRRAAILVANLDGTNSKVFAQGLRNSVFMTLHPVTKEIWATEMGRDLLGDDLPPDEINIVAEGKHYGWPYCYGARVHDESFDARGTQKGFCQGTEPSVIDLQAHSAPLGLAFADLGHLLVAYHGSWNRSLPTGYKIVKIDLVTKAEEDFVTGWLTPDGKVLGRPADILIDGQDIFISDDKLGVIYLLTRR